MFLEIFSISPCFNSFPSSLEAFLINLRKTTVITSNETINERNPYIYKNFLEIMHPLLKKLEHLTDRIIPYLLILLAIVLGVEFFFKEIAEEHYNLVLSADI